MVAEVARRRRVVPVPEAKKSLYVGDLHPSVEETDLVETFRFIGPLASVRLCRHFFTGKSLCYAYVNFVFHSHASKALECLNYTELKGKRMRMMWYQRDPLPRKSGIGNIFVKNLDRSITSAELQEIFGDFGKILSCKVAESNGGSKGFGFVQFESEDSALAAVGTLHNKKMNGKKLYVTKFVKKSERRAANEEETSFRNLFEKNLDKGSKHMFVERPGHNFGNDFGHVFLQQFSTCVPSRKMQPGNRNFRPSLC